MNALFIDIHCAQSCKDGQAVYGDTFLSKKLRDENRVISVLSDGLGSGVKASVLSMLTATMALNYTSQQLEIRRTADRIMKTLPVCSTRKISYATFSIVDIRENSRIEIVEYDNPPFLLIRNRETMAIPCRSLHMDGLRHQRSALQFTCFTPLPGDRILLASDGVTQSGMGRSDMPVGWGPDAFREFALQLVRSEPDIPASRLSQCVVDRAKENDGNHARDDISCAVLHIRRPRRLLVITGPPFIPKKDCELTRKAQSFSGKKIVCGGTTANILSRELGLPIHVDLSTIDAKIPPTSRMEGFELITEGTITLGRVAELLEKGGNARKSKPNGADLMVKSLLENDSIEFLVGTKINEAHQDPGLPVELDIRRNIVKKIRSLLEEKYLKETHLGFI